MQKKAGVIISTIIIIGVVVSGLIYFLPNKETAKTPVKIFHAGSLTIPFQEIEKKFEQEHPNVDIQLEAAGSVQCVSKITETGKIADVLATADWTLIRDMPNEYKDYTLQFAVNQMVICFTNESQLAQNISSDNFWIFLKQAKWGFANPNLDPCGYRTLMTIQLASMYYNQSTLFDDLIGKETLITMEENNGSYLIKTPEVLVDVNNPSEHVVIRDKSVDLITLLEEGGLDFAFEYLSVAKQHNLNYITLNDMIDLSNPANDEVYSKVSVLKADGSSVTAKSITYGITVPKNAAYPELGILFVEYVINSTGQEIFSSLGQPPLTPCRTTNLTATPEELKSYCIEI